jgi:hypothetical protein
MMDSMTDSRPVQQQRQLLLALMLFLVSQLTLALHGHDLSLHSVDTEECVVCLVTTSDNPGPISETPSLNFPAENTQHLPALDVQASQPQQTPSQPRAPPLS